MPAFNLKWIKDYNAVEKAESFFFLNSDKNRSPYTQNVYCNPQGNYKLTS